jgi:hypothetical protein
MKRTPPYGTREPAPAGGTPLSDPTLRRPFAQVKSAYKFRPNVGAYLAEVPNLRCVIRCGTQTAPARLWHPTAQETNHARQAAPTGGRTRKLRRNVCGSTPPLRSSEYGRRLSLLLWSFRAKAATSRNRPGVSGKVGSFRRGAACTGSQRDRHDWQALMDVVSRLPDPLGATGASLSGEMRPRRWAAAFVHGRCAACKCFWWACSNTPPCLRSGGHVLRSADARDRRGLICQVRSKVGQRERASPDSSLSSCGPGGRGR